MIITKRAIPRRMVLRGVGSALALPLLDSMVPALTAMAKTPARTITRLGIVYVPHGVCPGTWVPATEGKGFAFTATLEPLAAFRDRMTVISGLTFRQPERLDPRLAAGVHSRASTRFLTGVHPGRGLTAGVSMDQIAARTLGQETQLASLELGLDSNESGGACKVGSCAYLGTIAWSGPVTPLPMEHDPRAAFERLFGDSETTDPAVRMLRMEEKRSILDSVNRKIAQIRGGLGPSDRLKLGEYLEAVRDVERRLQKAEEQSSRDLPSIAQPSAVPATYHEHAKLMFDMQVLAYQCDLTRVITFMLGRELSGRTYTEIGVPDSFHPLSHHRNDPEKLKRYAKINAYHASLFAYYLEKLQATADGDGSLLDHVMLLYGSGIQDGNQHNFDDLPIVLAGGGGRVQNGRHVRFPKGTPLANLHLTLLDKLGTPIDHLGDSTGRVELLSDV